MQIRDKAFYAGERGFTLIELLVVISIISLLSSIVLTSVNSARAKARDARKQADFRAISTALQLYFDSTGRMPLNYSPGSGVCEGNSSFERSMQELVSAGFLPVIPRSPTSNSLYCYYDYGSGNNIGALNDCLFGNHTRYDHRYFAFLPSMGPWHKLVRSKQ